MRVFIRGEEVNIDPPANQIIWAESMFELSRWNSETVDLILTDPPYGIDYQSNRRVAQPKLPKFDGDKDLSFFPRFIRQAHRVLKQDRHIYICMRFDTLIEVGPMIAELFTIKNVIVWVKNHHGSGDLKGAFAPQYEIIVFAHKGRRELIGKRLPDVWTFDKVASSNLLHGAQKPLRMMIRCIEKSTQPGELVVDPFCGVGPSCKAAMLLGRQYIGIDSSRENATLARKNLEIRE